ncbi:FAD-binding protein [Arthrobacter sp. NPDC080031]|uniref:FAD-binding protein n=1 Tax=Arthrobacter sp. NPDC080031 TaxID=3155918 RepID=UPI00344C5128
MSSTSGVVADVDVVVVGFGAAGVAAAISAAESGASVLVLEKLPQEAHTPSAVFAGSMIMVATDIDAATRYLEECARDAVGPAECRAWAEGAAELEQWLKDRIPELEVHALAGHHGGALYPEFDGASAVITRDFRGPGRSSGSGEWLFRRLERVMEKTGRVEVRWGVRASRLLRTNRRIDGVSWEDDAGQQAQVRSRRAVVLATGGFENDQELCRTYLRAWPMYFAGNPANTGDGLRMAQAAGAGLWHMQVAIGRQAANFDLDGLACNYQMSIVPGAFVVVDSSGKRFCDESAYIPIHTTWAEMQEWNTRERGFSKIPAYWVFDARRFASRLAAGPQPQGTSRPRWSEDNVAELERGWVVSAPTIRELAEELGMDPDVLESEVRAFNAAVDSGSDAWGRDASTSEPLRHGPFYAVRMFPGGVNTSGGPRHDAGGRVLDAFGEPIEGLYAAGSVSQLIGCIYPSPGAGWSEALVTGTIAGAEAARNIDSKSPQRDLNHSDDIDNYRKGADAHYSGISAD